jgi:hypothetical protein
MRARSVAWVLTIVTLVMVAVVIWRVSQGWPAGPKTYAFIAVTLIALIATINAWRRGAPPAGA